MENKTKSQVISDYIWAAIEDTVINKNDFDQIVKDAIDESNSSTD